MSPLGVTDMIFRFGKLDRKLCLMWLKKKDCQFRILKAATTFVEQSLTNYAAVINNCVVTIPKPTTNISKSGERCHVIK